MVASSPPRQWQFSVTESSVTLPPLQGSVMSKSQLSPTSRLTPIERPRRPQCTSRMTLTSTSPGPIGFEHRLFDCPDCNSVQKRVVMSDPMKSASAGWLAGELIAPN
jgi:hypothetical protein